MNFSEFTPFFHDGSILSINDNRTGIEIALESSEISSFSSLLSLPLSKRNTLKGLLHLMKIQTIYIDEYPIKRPLMMKYSDGEILEFTISDKNVSLLIEWKNSPPKGQANDVSKIEIEAEKITWENIPHLEVD